MKNEKVIVSNDWQIPFHDERALDIFFQVVKDIKPDRIILAGDILDMYKVTSFDTDPAFNSEKEKLDYEIDIGIMYLTFLRKLVPKAKIQFVEGNHEYRLRKYIIQNAKELGESKKISDKVSLPSLLELDSLDIEYITSPASRGKWASTFVKVGRLYVGHFHKVNGHGAYTAKALVDMLGVSTMQGHTHRMGWSPRKSLDGTILDGYENGCLCLLDSTYTSTANWQHGFSIIDHDTETGEYYVQQIPIRHYVAKYGNKTYTA